MFMYEHLKTDYNTDGCLEFWFHFVVVGLANAVEHLCVLHRISLQDYNNQIEAWHNFFYYLNILPQ